MVAFNIFIVIYNLLTNIYFRKTSINGSVGRLDFKPRFTRRSSVSATPELLLLCSRGPAAVYSSGNLTFYITLIIGMHRILILPDIRPAGYSANLKTGCRISGYFLHLYLIIVGEKKFTNSYFVLRYRRLYVIDDCK